MKAYLVVTGSIFWLIGLEHSIRLFLDPGANLWFAWGNVGRAAIVGGDIAGWAGWLLGTRRAPNDDARLGGQRPCEGVRSL
jgi:hypothetical protein